MKYFLPIIIIASIFISSCSKDKDLSGDRLYSLYGVVFNKPAELKITSHNSLLNNGYSFLNYYLGFRNGEPWIALYDLDNNFVNEHSQALPDSIKANKSLNTVLVSSQVTIDDAILLSGFVRDSSDRSFRIAKVAYFIYSYNIKDKSIKRVIYDYGYPSDITLYTSFRRWYDGSIIASLWPITRTVLFNKDLKEIERHNGLPHDQPYKDSYYYPFYFSGYPNVYPTSMNEYFSFGRSETTLEINTLSTSAIRIIPHYPELPYYSYLKEQVKVELIERPSNYVRLDNGGLHIEDLGDKVEVTLTGTMVLSRDGNKGFYEKEASEISRIVLVDKKTGNVISK